MIKDRTIFSVIKNEQLKKKVRSIKLSDPFYFADSVQKTQEERTLAWMRVLAAMDQGIPVVFFGSNPNKKYVKYVKTVCRTLEIQPNVAILLFTSGSTGKPKPIQRTQEQLILSAERNIGYLGIDKDIVMADFRGLNHDSGFGHLLRSLIAGCKFVYIDSTQDYLNIVLDCIKKKVTYFDVTAMQWHGIARALEDNDLNWNLKIAVSTSGTLDKESIGILLKRTKCKIFSAYTMTEIGIVANLGPDKILEKHGSVGKVIHGISMKIVDETGKKCMPYEEGEIVFKSKLISYPNTSPYFSGDNGYLDEDGYLYLTGRKGDVLKINGRRINSMQIENAYKKYQNVVFGISVPAVGGHEGVIVVETEDSLKRVREYISVTEPPVSEVCRPRWIFVSKKLPRTISGKFDRLKIKKIYEKKIEKLKENADHCLKKNVNAEIEKNVIHLWQKVLNVDGISRNDDFFKLGGKSLRVISLISSIRRQFNIELIPEQIYKNSTVKKLSKIIRDYEK